MNLRLQKRISQTLRSSRRLVICCNTSSPSSHDIIKNKLYISIYSSNDECGFCVFFFLLSCFYDRSLSGKIVIGPIKCNIVEPSQRKGRNC